MTTLFWLCCVLLYLTSYRVCCCSVAELLLILWAMLAPVSYRQFLLLKQCGFMRFNRDLISCSLYPKQIYHTAFQMNIIKSVWILDLRAIAFSMNLQHTVKYWNLALSVNFTGFEGLLLAYHMSFNGLGQLIRYSLWNLSLTVSLMALISSASLFQAYHSHTISFI